PVPPAACKLVIQGKVKDMRVQSGIRLHPGSVGELLVVEFAEVILELEVGPVGKLDAEHRTVLEVLRPAAEPPDDLVDLVAAVKRLFLVDEGEFRLIAGIEEKLIQVAKLDAGGNGQV